MSGQSEEQGGQCMLDLVVPALEERECCTASWELKSNCSPGSHGRNNIVCLSETPLIDGYFLVVLLLLYW